MHKSIKLKLFELLDKYSIGIAVFLMYVMACAIRLILLEGKGINPSIFVDESLYINLTRSLHLRMGNVLHAQPVGYRSFLYPLILSPLFGLPAGTNIYHIAQIVNILLMNFSVFPAAKLARYSGCSEKNVLITAFFSLLLPDIFITRHYMTESLMYPTALFTLLALANFLDKQNFKNIFKLSLALFLMFAIKEGAVVMLIAVLVVLLVKVFKEKDKILASKLFQLVVTFIVLFCLSWIILRFVFSADIAARSIYQNMYAGFSIGHIMQTLGGLLVYLLFIPVGFGLVPILLPLCGIKQFPENNRWFLSIVFTSLLFFIIGICYQIFSDEMFEGVYSTRIHMRYVFFFLPVLVGALFSKHLRGFTVNKQFMVFLVIFVTLLMVLGLGVYSPRSVDSYLLSFLEYENDLIKMQTLFTMFYLSASGLMIYSFQKAQKNRNYLKIFCVFLVVQLILSNVMAYKKNSEYSFEPDIRTDTLQASIWLDEGADAMMVSEWADGWANNNLTALDSVLRRSLPLIALEDVLSCLDKDTINLPAYWYAGEAEINRPQRALINKDALNKIKLNPKNPYTITDNGYFYLIELEDPIWILHGLCGLRHAQTVTSESALWIYDKDLIKKGKIEILFNVSSNEESEITFSRDEFSQRFNVGSRSVQCKIVVETNGLPIKIDIKGKGTVWVNSYLISVI